jgi:SAM-dependent methyltransferase
VITDALLSRLRCPRCGSPMTGDDGGLSCPAGHRFPRRDGYYDCSEAPSDPLTSDTIRSFGYQWNAFDEIDEGGKANWLEWFADVPWDELRDAVALDAGCGRGQFSLLSAPHLGSVVALDGSLAVRTAARHLANVPNACVVRADLHRTPLAPGSLDFVFCMGVLHHLADPARGLRTLARLLHPGGLLLFFVYSRPEHDRGIRPPALRVLASLRFLTVRTPRRLLRALSWPVAAAVYLAFVLPAGVAERLGSHRLRTLPMAGFRGQSFYNLWGATFDLLATPSERRYVRAEVDALVQGAGLEPVSVREHAGWVVLARARGTGLALRVRLRPRLAVWDNPHP